MSSSIDFFDCPQCGGQAHREQDNRTGEITYSCKCGWNGGPVDDELVLKECRWCGDKFNPKKAEHKNLCSNKCFNEEHACQ